MSSYRDLKVWQKSRVLAKEIYTLTATFPKAELFGLTTQMRRAALSILSNLAEGKGRRSARDQAKFYYIARGSLLELEAQLFVSRDLSFVEQQVVEERLSQTEEIGRMLNGLISSIAGGGPEARGPRPEA